MIALNEPLERDLFLNSQEASRHIEHAFKKFRKTLLKSGKARARTLAGEITDNAFSISEEGRKRQVVRTEVIFDKKLNKDFILVMKHCAEFSLILPALTQRFCCFAMIRNPLALLGSWMSVDVSVSRGKVSKSARLNPAFHQSYQGIEDLSDRQLHILSWYFGQYTDFPAEHIIKYEDMISDPRQALLPITSPHYLPPTTLENRNQHAVYDKQKLVTVGKKLLASEGAYWQFYNRAEVNSLLDQMQS